MLSFPGVGYCVGVAALALACASVEPFEPVVELDAAPSQGGYPVDPLGSGGVTRGGAPPSGVGGYAVPLGAGGTPPMMTPVGFPPFGMGGRIGAGSGSGGRPGSGGRTGASGHPAGSGGVPATSATGGTPSSVSVGGGTSGPVACTSNEKTCNGVCVQPSPKVGCGMTGCDACTTTAPANGYVTCTSGQCAFDCLSGYMKNGMACEGPPPSMGGGSCPSSPLGCPSCGVIFGPGCCAGSKCGCSPIPWTVGVLGCI
ncbi:MAG TPA: hypothetical protein VHU80_14665 [Polyangiaceae bacterium]|nr:hypothetical protein [Polyangiaceae bacterium]